MIDVSRINQSSEFTYTFQYLSNLIGNINNLLWKVAAIFIFSGWWGKSYKKKKRRILNDLNLKFVKWS